MVNKYESANKFLKLNMKTCSIFVITSIIRLLYPIKGFSVTIVITINITMIYPIKASIFKKRKYLACVRRREKEWQRRVQKIYCGSDQCL